MKKLTIDEILNTVSAVKAGNGVAVYNLNGVDVKARSHVFYAADLATNLAGRNNQIVYPSQQRLLGTTNFEKGNVLPDGWGFLVTGVRALFDTQTGAGVTTATAAYGDPAPLAFDNGEFVLGQQGSGDILNMPVNQITKVGDALSTENEFVSVVPFMLRDKSPIEWQVILAGNATANDVYRFELQGILFTNASLS